TLPDHCLPWLLGDNAHRQIKPVTRPAPKRRKSWLSHKSTGGRDGVGHAENINRLCTLPTDYLSRRTLALLLRAPGKIPLRVVNWAFTSFLPETLVPETST